MPKRDSSLVTAWLNRRSRTSRAAALGLAGAVTAMGQAPFDVPVLTLLGLVFLFLCVDGVKTPRTVALWVIVFASGYFATTWHWIVEPFLVDVARHGVLAPLALLGLSCGIALFWGGAGWVGARIGGPVALATALAGAELARAYVLTGFPWGMVSQTLVSGIAGQVLAWIGPHGANFALFGAAALVAWLLSGRHLGFALVAIVVCGAVLHWPMPTRAAQEDGARVRIVQPNAPQHQKWDPEHIGTFYRRAVELTKGGGGAVDLVVWPETSVPLELNDAHSDLEFIQSLAGDAVLVTGVRRFDRDGAYNAAVVTTSSEAVAQVYDKFHLVPFGEYLPLGAVFGRLGLRGLAAEDGNGFAAGTGPVLFDLGTAGKALPLICYEMVFPHHAASAVRPDFILQITNDAWFGAFSGPYQHLAQARMRAIEQGLPVIRAANTGVSAIIGPQGRIVAALGLNKAGFLYGLIPKANAPTLYARTGDMPVLVLIGLVLAVLGVLRRRETH